MPHRFALGQQVYFDAKFGVAVAGGAYKIVKLLPVGIDRAVSYRIKSAAEIFERTVDENQLRQNE